MNTFDDLPLEFRRANWGWFGEPWPSGICYKTDEITGADVIPHEWNWDMHVATPVGTECWWCHEEIIEGDQGQMMPSMNAAGETVIGAQHRECGLRSVMGGLAHQQRRCTCFGGTVDDMDLGKMTLREEAIAVWESIVRPIR
jgi:hypothetical protein